ncbi:MAG: sigma-70 family RNA polymerase sigma factor [Deltaproteobacteria bacterium]|nr:sigma-70 family RNA polymerase sigma factor [Deltaproteobacteria bacterium]
MAAHSGCATGVPRLMDSREDLVDRLRRGETEALGEAYDLHAPAVLSFARRLVGEDAAAHDLLQEVFLTLPSAIGSFRGASTLRTFLVSIAVNHARHHVRGAARRRAAMSRYGHEDVDPPSTPEHHAERADLARRLTAALDELPLDQRVAFVLCEVEERTAGEVAAIVGAPEATVRTRVFHARKKLREKLGGAR